MQEVKKVRREIDPIYLPLISKFREQIGTIPRESRLCPKHKEEVEIREKDFNDSNGIVPPFSAEFVGCCNNAIDITISLIKKVT